MYFYVCVRGHICIFFFFTDVRGGVFLRGKCYLYFKLLDVMYNFVGGVFSLVMGGS